MKTGVQLRQEEIIVYAKQLIENPLLDEIMTAMESAALARGVNAAPSDNDTRLNAMAEIRAIRSFRSHCRSKLDNT